MNYHTIEEALDALRAGNVFWLPMTPIEKTKAI